MASDLRFPLAPTPFVSLGSLGLPNAAVLDSFQGESCDAPRESIRYPLDGTMSDAEQIITLLARMAVQYGKNPCIIGFARCLVRQVTVNNDWRSQFDAVADFVLNRIVYQADPRGAEYVRSPVQMLKDYAESGHSSGDCDDHVLLLNSLLNALGFKTRVLAVMLHSSSVFDHVIAQVQLGGTWYEFDPCNKNAPWTTYQGDRLAADS